MSTGDYSEGEHELRERLRAIDSRLESHSSIMSSSVESDLNDAREEISNYLRTIDPPRPGKALLRTETTSTETSSAKLEALQLQEKIAELQAALKIERDRVLFVVKEIQAVSAKLIDDGYTIEPHANLARANLAGAYLGWANLTCADLSGANLAGINLGWANLRGAILTDADLTGAILTGADLTRAYLIRAKLAGADLTGAILTYADLTDADLTDAILTGATMPDGSIHG